MENFPLNIQVNQSNKGRAIFAKLRDVLAHLYLSETSSRRIAEDAGLDTRRIYFSTQALDNWHAILTEAVRANKLDALLDAALIEYDVNTDLLAACDIYHRFTKEGGRIISPSDQTTVSTIINTLIDRIFSPTDDQWLHQRQAMLSRVKTYWIKGVLEKSLYGATLIDLGLEYKPEAVTHPWDMIVQPIERLNHLLPPGTKISDVFDEQNGELLILGTPGSGKTTILLDLARTLIFRAEQDETSPLPVVFNLSSWAQQRQPLNDWLVNELNVRYQVPKMFGSKWVRNGQILPLLDGLDEVPSDHQAECVEAINRFRSESGILNMAVCSRLGDYEALRTKLKLQGAVILQPFTLQQIDDYLFSLGNQVTGVKAMLQEDMELQELAKSPLMLSILILTYHGRPAQEIPLATSVEERRKNLFNAYVERMFKRRGYERQFLPEQTIRWLSWLGRRMAENSQSVFFFEQLQPNWLTRRQERMIYMLFSRLLTGCLIGIIIVGVIISAAIAQGKDAGGVLQSALLAWLGSMIGGAVGGLLEFRRYEAAPAPNIEPVSSLRRTVGLVMGKMAIIAIGVLFGLSVPTVTLTFIVNALLEGRSLLWSFTWALQEVLPFTLGVAIYNALLLGSMFGLRARTRTQSKDIQTIEAFQFSKRGALAGVLVGALIGFGLALLNREGPSWTIHEGLDYLLRYCTLGTLIGGLTGKKVEVSYRPNQGILRSAQKAIVLGVTVTLIFGLLGAMAVGPIYGFWRGMIVGLLLFMWYGGSDVTQHYTLRTLLALRNYAPWNYTHFLDFAVERIFLQKVGPGYLFIHRSLLEYFATLDDVKGSPPL